MAAVGGPGDVGDPLPIGRPRWLKLPLVRRREPLGRAAGYVHRVELREDGEHDAFAVRRKPWRLYQARLHRSLLDAIRRVEIGPDRQVDVGLERNDACATARDVDRLDLAVEGDDQLAAVARKRKTRQEIARTTRFLLVALNGPDERAIFSSFEIANAESGFRLVARAVNEESSVRRDDRPNRAELRLRDDVHVAAAHVASHDLPTQRRGRPAGRRGAAREVE